MKENTAVIATYSKEYRAELARDYLKEAGIDAFISKDDAGGMDPQLQLTQGVRLIVREHEMEKAEELLDSLETGAGEETPEQSPEEYVEQKTRMWRQLSQALFLLGGVAMALGFMGGGFELNTIVWAGIIGIAVGTVVYLISRADRPEAPSST